jgi:hypothetical protein
MNQYTWVGLDVHADSITAAILEGDDLQPQVVPPENTVRPAAFELTMISLYHSLYDIYPFLHAVLCPEVPPRTSVGEPRPSPPTRCPAKKC